MKNITLFNQVNLLQSFCKRMATATTSCAHSYKRYYLLLTILLFVGVNNAWGAPSARYFLIGNPTGSWNKDDNYKIQTRYEKDGKYVLYVYAAKDNYFRLKKDDGADYGPSNDGSTTQGYGTYTDKNAWKYNGSSGIVRFGVDETSGDNGEHYPYVFWEKVEVKIKHNWNGTGTWSEHGMIDKGDGTYEYTGYYSGTNATNFGIGSDGKTMKYITNATLKGTLSKGNKALFTYNSSGYKGYGSETQNTGSATITRLYTITYDGNGQTGGTVPEAVDKKHGTNITLSNSTPTRTGYTFTGWNTKQNGTGTSYAKGATYLTDSDVTLYAQWKGNNYKVTLDDNGGSGGSGTVSATYGSVMPVIQIPTRTGYTFNGYWTGTTINSTQYYNADGTSAKNWDKAGNTTTLHALWIPNTYTVQFNGHGSTSGSMEDQQFIYDKEQALSANQFTRVGYSFAGWNTAANGLGTSYDDEEDVINLTTENGATIMLYAQWFELVVTQLQWSEDYYTATMEADNDFPDLTILPNDFAGVLTYQSSNPAVATIAADGTITLIGTGTTTITASIAADDTYLAASDSYELTVAASNCRWVEVTDNTTLEDGDKVVITMTKYGSNGLPYTYALPNAENTSSAPKATDVSTYIDGNELNYNENDADDFKWIVEKKEGNYIFHPANNGTLNLYCNNDENGVRVGSSSNAKTNQVFSISGNYLLNNATSRYLGVSLNTNPYTWRCYTANDGVIKDQTLKFYKCVCLDSEHYWLTWDATDGQFADGSKQIVKDYAVGTTINKPFDPTRTGYEFAGWSTDGVNVVTPADKMPEENLSYSAVWQIKSYTVTWDAAGGQFEGGQITIAQTYEYGATITPPNNPTRTGYTFKGWAPNVPTNMPTEDLNFVAQWQVNQYTVTWNPGKGGHWDNSFDPIVENYNYGDPINKPANPEKAGYVFDKWEPDVVATMPNNNLTYTAKWNEAFCDAYTFHTGNENVWNDPQEQICFEFKANHEWQIVNYVIPTSDAQSHFLVAYKGWPQIDQGTLGGHSKSATRTWSYAMYLAPSMDSNDGNGSPKVGHAKGAVGTLRIFDNSNWENLYVGFIPNGYKLKFGANEYDFIHHEDAEYRSEIVEYNATTANNNVSVGVINTSNAYVKTDHTQEGMRHVFVRDKIGWMNDGAKVAIYYWKGDKNGWSGFLTKVPGETNLYVGLIPVDYTSVKLIRYKDTYAGAPGSWNSEDRWNETGDLTISTTQQLLTFSDWNNNPTASTYKHKGKFRIYNNLWDKNWYVHFYPHYVITFDKNAVDATGTMPPQALPLDATPMTMVLNACAFERRGYDFTGWKTDVAITADGEDVAANGKVKDKATISNINKDITLKAQWNAQAYTITYQDQGDVAYSGENEASLPQTHTYDQMTTLVAGVKTGYTFGGWYTTPECVGTAVTELGAQDYTADITLYAKWTFAMEYNITNTETIFITSAKGQKIKATIPIVLSVNNMPAGTKVAISAPNITFYDEVGNVVTDLTTNSISESFSLSAAYTPADANITEQPTITLSVLGNEKTIEGLISARSLPATFAIVAKVGNMWYALPSQGLNSTDALVGYPVEVDNMADPTKVTAVPANADWSLRQVYEAIRDDATKDRYAKNGHNLVFVNADNKTLYASKDNANVQTYAEYSNYAETNPDRYEWVPTTTDLVTYTLKNVGRAKDLSINVNATFGTHASNVASSTIRFLPIQNRYIPAALQVVEWKENSVVIMYNGDPAQTASVSVNGAEAQNTTLSAAQRDIAVYELAADGLAANPTQRLSITIGTEKAILPIPYIIGGTQTDYDLLPGSSVSAKREAAKVSDLVILEEATLTAAGTNKNDPYKFRHVTIYGGGKLVIPENNSFGVASLTLRAGGITDAGEYDYVYDYVYPQFELRGTFTNSAAKINYDYITDYDHWFHLVLPFDGDLGTIKYPTEFYGANVAANNTGSWQIKRYAGEIRATGNYNAWVDIETEGKTSTTAGQGYIFWGAPKKVTVNGETARQKWGIQRITMSVTAPNAMTAENGDKAISELSSYANVPNNSGKDNDQGWNLIGNPYMVNLTDMSTSGLHACKLVEAIDPVTGKWNGQWEWNDETNIRYLTIPSEHFDTYEAKTVSEAISANALVPGRAFFVQLDGEANGITFATANRASLMPALLAENSDKPVDIETGIILSNETLQDEVNFWIKDGKTNDYEYNADYPKTPNNNHFNIYGVHTNGDLSWVAINPLLATESMPIGYQVPAAGTYILSLSETYYSEDLEALYVTDHEMSPEVTVDLINAPYEFSVNQAETNNERFTISLKLKSENQGPTTGWENIDVGKDQSIKFIHQDRLYILRNGIIYDTTGQQIQTINK